MALRVIITPKALSDLENIVCYIAFDSPDRARSFGHSLVDQALELGAFPEMGRVMPELNDPAIRETVYYSYRIIYEIRRDPEALYILRFWHAARGEPNLGRRS